MRSKTCYEKHQTNFLLSTLTFPHRASSLSAAQESALTVFTQFLDTQLLPMSNEKRSVAAHLTTLLVQRCPAEYLPIALTPVRFRLCYLIRNLWSECNPKGD